MLADMLEAREIDLTFSCDASVIRKFKQYPFFQDHILLAVPPDLPLSGQAEDCALTAADILNGRHLEEFCPTVSLKLFEHLEFVLLTEENNLHERAVRLFEREEITPRIKTELSQLATAFHLAEKGFAATFVSDRIIQSPDVPLFFYKLGSDVCRRSFYMLTSNERYIASAVKKLQQYLSRNR